jgi:lipoyl(octanoyl) transferase
MKETVLKAISISDFALTDYDLSALDSRTVIVRKWNWDYTLSHRFQRAALELVQATPNLRILICCNHPQILTNGRGIQKPRKGEALNLVEFKVDQHKNLPYPFFQIERGGGLTFHHPGQFIFYPILKLNPASLSLSKLINQIFDISTDVLRSWGLEGVTHQHQLLGLWHQEKKIASMGIAIEKLTTFHGMALNLSSNITMLEALNNLNPCGLRAETYTSVEALINMPPNPQEVFLEQFIQRIRNEWK